MLRWVAIAAALIVIATFLFYQWAFAEASWPRELENPRTAQIFSNVEQPTDADRLVLAALVTEIAQADPIVIGLLNGRPWPEPDVAPVFWTKPGDNARSVLIGGWFELDLGGANYQGPWPSTGCSGGRYQGHIATVKATNLQTVGISVDLTFERVTHVSVGPAPYPNEASPVIETVGDQQDAPWYTGSCPRISGPA